nr:hypothetical protein [Candidatus Sigynarchaeum springense]
MEKLKKSGILAFIGGFMSFAGGFWLIPDSIVLAWIGCIAGAAGICLAFVMLMIQDNRECNVMKATLCDKDKAIYEAFLAGTGFMRGFTERVVKFQRVLLVGAILAFIVGFVFMSIPGFVWLLLAGVGLLLALFGTSMSQDKHERDAMKSKFCEKCRVIYLEYLAR